MIRKEIIVVLSTFFTSIEPIYENLFILVFMIT